MVHTCVLSVYQNKYTSKIRANKKFMLHTSQVKVYIPVSMKPQGGDIPNIRSLGGGHCHVQLCILGSPTPLPLQIKNQEANVMMNLNYIS
jgi:hypothetical protein